MGDTLALTFNSLLLGGWVVTISTFKVDGVSVYWFSSCDDWFMDTGFDIMGAAGRGPDNEPLLSALGPELSCWKLCPFFFRQWRVLLFVCIEPTC